MLRVRVSTRQLLTKLQRDDKALVILAQEAVKVLDEAEFWATQPVGLQRVIHRLRLHISLSQVRPGMLAQPLML